MTLSPADLLQEQLLWLRLLIAREVGRFRAGRRRGADGFQGFYIGEEDVDRLLSEPLDRPPALGEPGLETRIREQAARVRAVSEGLAAGGVPAPLDRLGRLFGLGPDDVSILLAAAAPDLDQRFETLYAYLHDDLARRRPTAGLVLALFGGTREREWRLRDRLRPGSPLLVGELLRIDGDATFPSRELRVDDRVLDELIGLPARIDARLGPFARSQAGGAPLGELGLADGERDALAGLARLWGSTTGLGALQDGARPATPAVVLEGGAAIDLPRTAGAVAALLGRPRVTVDLSAGAATDLAARIGLIRREALLAGAAIVLDARRWDPAREHAAWLARALEPLLRAPPTPLLVLSEGNDPWWQVRELELRRLRLEPPALPERRALWRAALDDQSLSVGASEIDDLAARYVLAPSQVEAAVRAAQAEIRIRNGRDPVPLAQRLSVAARDQSRHGLDALARKLRPRARWDDIVLPAATRRHLREIAGAYGQRARLLDNWGFAAKLSRGRGVTALFAGASGTGKTMAAEVLANELSLDLYAIDLAATVSKYIGETEKNLARIFGEARDSHAILFFDEADALFGRRSEVRDAHDRYANVEVAYLLQELEAYSGMAILASNLSKNIDDAFTRRIQHIVEFPSPDEALREQIWRRSFTPTTPGVDELDYRFLAQRFELAGGHIRSAALTAAGVSAGEGRGLTMASVCLAVAREYRKLGRVAASGDFGAWTEAVLEGLGAVG